VIINQHCVADAYNVTSSSFNASCKFCNMCWDRSGSNSVAAKKVQYALLQARGETGALTNNHWLVSLDGGSQLMAAARALRAHAAPAVTLQPPLAGELRFFCGNKCSSKHASRWLVHTRPVLQVAHCCYSQTVHEATDWLV
jgi:hypothetical protein